MMKGIRCGNLILRRNMFLAVTAAIIFVTSFSYISWQAAISYQRNRYYRLLLNARQMNIQRIRDYQANNKKVKRLPDVIGIGVKKCGTDGIISFLSHHPQVVTPKTVETFYFSHHFKKPLTSYKALMPLASDIEIVMEKTPVYFDHTPLDLPERIKKALPHVKLILVVCDPVARAYSDYVHERVRYDLYNSAMMRKFSTFDQYLDAYLPKLKAITSKWNSSGAAEIGAELTKLYNNDLDATALSTGIYAAHIQRWKRVFNDSELKVVDGQRFMHDPGSVLLELQQFIGIPKIILREDFVRHPDTGYYCYRRFEFEHLHNVTLSSSNGLRKSLKCLAKSKGRTRNGKMSMSAKANATLREFYKPFQRMFEREIGETYGW